MTTIKLLHILVSKSAKPNFVFGTDREVTRADFLFTLFVPLFIADLSCIYLFPFPFSSILVDFVSHVAYNNFDEESGRSDQDIYKSNHIKGNFGCPLFFTIIHFNPTQFCIILDSNDDFFFEITADTH